MEIDILKGVAGFEWDTYNIAHIAEHDVLTSEAEEVFIDKNNVLDDDPEHSLTESRFLIIGKTKQKRLLYQIFTRRGDKIRVISSRDISKLKEVKLYEKETGRTKVSK